jgi:LysM repeat protein
MKLTKIFGIVLSLHVGVILLVMFQPGCQTAKQKDDLAPVPQKLGSTEQTDSFNSGLGDTPLIDTPADPISELQEPTRPVVGEIFVPGSDSDYEPGLPQQLSLDNAVDSNSFNLRPSDVTIYKIEKGDTLWGIARKKNISLKILLGSNPNLTNSSKLRIGQELMIPSIVSSSSLEPTQSNSSRVEVPVGSSTYTVRGGDNLSRIANLHSISLSALLSENEMTRNSIIKPGQVLIIPKESKLKADSNVPTSYGNISIEGNRHLVKKGENLTRIALIYGTSVQQIMEWNSLSDAGKLGVGQSLIVSDGSTSPLKEVIDIPTVPEGQDPASLQDFFNGVIEQRPVIDVPEQP